MKDYIHSEYSLKIKKAKEDVTYLIEQIKATKNALSQDKINKNEISYKLHSIELGVQRSLAEEKSKELVSLKSKRRNYQHNLGIEKRDADLSERKLKFIDWQKTYNVYKHKKDIMEYRMYAMVLRQLNPMQKGVQALHAVVEYGQDFSQIDARYNKWADCDKTMIILDGGTAPEITDCISSLEDLNVAYSIFQEPDLYDMTTAIAFLAEERVWNTKDYPDYSTYSSEKTRINPDENGVVISLLILPPTEDDWAKGVFNTTVEEARNIINFRQFIFSKKLSQ